MKKDAEVLRYMRERRKSTNQELAAARAGMSVKTARKYERAGRLPSQLKQPRRWRTRPNPFEEDWPWVVEQLQRDPALQGATLFAELCQRHPGKYRPTQVRTLQRHIAQWRSVSRFSTIQVLGKRYSVPCRFSGTTVLARVHAETVEVYVGTRQVLTLPRLQGATTHAVNYRHVIWSLVRKPGAFAHYRYREDLFPTLAFRQAYDALCKHLPQHADRHHVRVLHLAATTSESEVETAIGLLLEHSQLPTFDAVSDLVRVPQIPALGQMQVNLQAYDQLLSSQKRRSHG